MKKLIYVLMFLAFASLTNAQWSEQVSGVTTTLYSVSAVDNNVVWICGAGGKVLRTINGGTNWALTTSPNAALDLYNIYGIDANTALVTGSGTTAYVYKTFNGGANWTLVFSQVGGFMNAICQLSAANNDAMFMTGDPVGGRWSLWMSTNAGTTWDSTGLYLPQAGTETGYNNSLDSYRGPYYLTKIWFGTNNTRIYNFKYGIGWTSQPTTGQANSIAVTFRDSLIGLGGSNIGPMYTGNGGQNWLIQNDFPGSGSVTGVAYTYEWMYCSRGTSVYFAPFGTGNWAAATTQTGTYNHLTRANSDRNLNNI